MTTKLLSVELVPLRTYLPAIVIMFFAPSPAANGLGLDDGGSITDRSRDFSRRNQVQTNPLVHPVSCPMGTQRSFFGVEQAEREVD